MEKGLYFLAVAYHGTTQEKAYRHSISLKVTANCLRQGIHVFAPVIYVNQIVDEMKLPSTDERRKIVMPYLFDFLNVSKGLILITVEGWQDSWGVQQELEFCKDHKIPVYKIDPDQIDGNLIQLLSQPIEASQLLVAA